MDSSRFFTEPLQDSLFRKLRGIVLGYKQISILNDDKESASQKRVRRDISEGNIKWPDDSWLDTITVQSRRKIQDTLNYTVTVNDTKRSDETVTDEKLSYVEIVTGKKGTNITSKR